MHDWRYYDFDANWTQFYDLWISDPVQEVLKPSMIRWCETQAYFKSDGTKPQWQPKSDLWTYSRTDYHSQRMLDKANEHVQNHHLIKKFGESLARAGTPVRDPELLGDYFLRCGGFDEIEQRFAPPAKSLEANVLMMGANFLAEAQAFAGEIMFPGKDTEVWADDACENEIAVVPEAKIILDFQRCYHWKNGSKDLNPVELMKAFGPMCFEYEL